MKHGLCRSSPGARELRGTWQTTNSRSTFVSHALRHALLVPRPRHSAPPFVAKHAPCLGSGKSPDDFPPRAVSTYGPGVGAITESIEPRLPTVPGRASRCWVSAVLGAVRRTGMASRTLGTGHRGVAERAVRPAVIQTFVYPNAYNEHLVWGAILVLLLTRGPGRTPHRVDWRRRPSWSSRGFHEEVDGQVGWLA